jgi:hypothetical protein
MKLLQSLDRIQKKLDKENGSSKSRSHSSPDEKGTSRSVSRHHHHSPSNCNRREPSSSSLSPVRKHKKGFGVDELQG